MYVDDIRHDPAHIAHVKKYAKKKALKKSYFYDAMEEMRESYGLEADENSQVAFLYVSDDMKWGRHNIKDKHDDLYFVGSGHDHAFDFALLCHSNHSIITRGSFSFWVGHWTGGEYYTEYGSMVPNEACDPCSAYMRALKISCLFSF